ncbi:hypothetical protein EHQ12_08120 [Leptospira gomenensis]|uniref:Uncharacterized protein n=1 Tax=Leptospira gomenensis TaxID=2484974 RepID=A0A5F1Z3V2_9LEPT|nr:hypothetical protein [Leptospira gomenensis]TGK35972.1 hypothetical protein EHQ17_05175 [Leptospira gomenensis]TGK39997.1 hypothetical protein EHQ12_08120 [Leptospira gomenensis]TGK51446.1 hypothetical protein EHQ07_02510 [Leptospira gomenensis]TGK68003.1 hypothetical protein EHQ13_01045 [Leptospira gomenensis]
MSSNQVCSFQFVSSDSVSSIYILFTGVIDLQQTKIDRLELIAVGQPENISPIRLSISTYKDVVNLCQKLKYEGKQLKNLTNKLTELFQSNGKSDDFMEQIMHYMKNKDKEKISYLLNQVINQAAGNSKPDIQIHYAILDRDRLEEESQSFAAPTSNSTASEESNSRFDDEDLPSLESSSESYRSAEPVDNFIPAGAKVIPMKYVLSPVSGVQINALKPGDKIMIQLLKADASSQSIIESMKLETPEGQVRSVPGTVVTSKNNGVENETLIQIGADVFGKIYEEENSIKVKPYTGEKPIQTSTAGKAPVKNQSSEDSGLLITILIAFGILGIAMTAIFVFLL